MLLQAIDITCHLVPMWSLGSVAAPHRKLPMMEAWDQQKRLSMSTLRAQGMSALRARWRMSALRARRMSARRLKNYIPSYKTLNRSQVHNSIYLLHTRSKKFTVYVKNVWNWNHLDKRKLTKFVHVLISDTISDLKGINEIFSSSHFNRWLS